MGNFDDLFEDDSKKQAGFNLRFGIERKPDDAARDIELAKRYKLPAGVISEYKPDYETKAKMEDGMATIDQSPKLRGWLAKDKTNAEVSHDDLGSLSALEKFARDFMNPNRKRWMGSDNDRSTVMNSAQFSESVRETMRSNPALDVYEATKLASKGVTFDANKEWHKVERTALGTVGDAGVATLKSAIGLPQAFVGLASMATGGHFGKDVEEAGLDFKRAQAFLSTGYSEAQQAANKKVDDATGFQDTLFAMLRNPSTIATTSVESLASMLGGAGVARGLLAKSPKLAPWLAAAIGEGTVGAGSMAEKLRSESDDGLLTIKKTFASAMSGVGTAFFGAAGGKLAQKLKIADLDTILVKGGMDDVAAGQVKQGFLSSVVKAGLSEGGFEELPQSIQEQMWQNFAEDKPIMDGVGKAAAQALVTGTAMGSGAQAAVHVARGAAKQDAGAAQAEQHAQVLESMQKTMQASKLLARSPETMTAYAQELVNDGIPEVHIDAAKLVAAGVDMNVLAQAMPSVAAQIQIMQPGGDLVIPTGELLVNSMGQEFQQALIDHARTDVNGMSRVEAKEYMATKGDAMNAEIERVMAEREGDSQFKAGRDELQTKLHDELNAVGRFTPKVNEQYATLAANFYAVMAARTGMTVQQFADTYKLGFKADEVGGQRTMDQVTEPSVSDNPEKWAGQTKDWADSASKTAQHIVDVGDIGIYKDTRANWNEGDDGQLIAVDKNGGVVGNIFFSRREDGKLEAAVEVAPSARRKGVATAMYDAVEAARGEKLVPAEKQSNYAKAFWSSRTKAQGGSNILNQADIENPKTGVSAVLLTLGKNDDLYQYPRSDAMDVRDIAADKSWVTDKGEVATIKVEDVDKNSDDNKLWMLANTTPADDAAAGTKSWILTLPTGKRATLTQKNGEVYINVSGVGEGNGGSAIYDLAANYALNNGLVFVGDPNGVSPAAMRRRLENMLSSAIKYGTTDHLLPHPDQYLGDDSIGVPPLDWTKGDTLSNIRSMVDVSIASTEHSNPTGATLVYDNASDSFKDSSTGEPIGAEEIARMAAWDRGTPGTGKAGSTTLQRTALFKSLVQSEGARRAFLESVRRQQDSGSANPSGALAGTFYQGDVKPADSPYETDLFGNPVPAPTGKSGSAARRPKAKGGDVHTSSALRDTPTPAGEYHVRTIVGSETTRKLGASQITNSAELAQATAYLYRSAVERFDGIVTDKDGKPLGVIGGFKGAISQTSVYPGTLVAEAVRIPGAAHVWFSHNHPSGNPSLSSSDLNLTRMLADVFQGSGVEPMGLMAVSGGQFSFTRDGVAVDYPQPIEAPTTETPVPVVEREQLPAKSELESLSSPQEAKRIAATYYTQAKGPGVILLNARNQVTAWVPVSPEMMGSLRHTGGLGAIYRAVSESNASAAIIVHGGELATQGNLPGGSTPSANIAAALAKVDVQPLDSINVKTMASAAEQGLSVAASTMYQEARGQIAFGNDITQQASIISLLKNADLSTFIHESGHFFLEVQADLANKMAARMASGGQLTEGEQSIADDFNKTLEWMGVKATPEMSALDAWAYMSAEGKRPYHEQWARGFEAYAFEGKSPSLELTKMFQTFRAWLVNVYRALLKSVNASKTDVAGALNVELSDEVRGVMDRMLATSDQIAEAEAARSMGPLFKSAEQAGMTLEEFKAYHDQGTQATMDAVDDLQGKGLRDMQWLSSARSRKLKELQKQHDALRAQVAREVRAEVMAEPIYRAWTFLTSRAVDKVVGEKKVGKASSLNPEVDNLFEAIAKLGGLDRAEVKKLWGVGDKEKLESGVFGAPVLRKTGGLSTDAMAERLMEAGYLLPDENGKADHDAFERLFDDQSRGTDRYSIQRDVAAAYGDAPTVLPDMPDVGFGRLSTTELRRRYGVADDAVWRKLSERRMTSDDGGLDPDVVGELFEFSSGDELVKTLATAEPPKDVINRKTDERMLQEHGDLSTPAGLERAADAAIHNDARARFVATELKALQKAMTARAGSQGQKHTVDVLVRAAKENAQAIIARLKVRDVRPGQYAAAEARAAKAAEKAVGDVAQAAMHKRNQLINMYAAKEAYAVQDEVRSTVNYFKKFDKPSKTLDPEYQAQIDQLLESVELRAASLKAIDRRKTLAEWALAQEDMGLPAEIPEHLLLEANRKSIKDMTVEEVRGLRDTIKQIEHLGRLKHKLLKAKDQREFAAIVAEAGASIRENGGSERPVSLETPTGVMPWLEGFAAGHRKMSSLLRQMDGSQDGGPLWNILGRTMNDAGTQESVMNEQATIALAELYAPMLKLKGGLNGDLRFIPEIKNSLTRGGRLSVALNWGNETNRQRIKGGDNWTDEQVGAIFKTLTREEWAFVQKTWDYIGTFWPEIAAKQKRVTGIEPEKVEASPFSMQLADGEIVNLTGGYYPIQYDANRDDKAEKHDAAAIAKDMLGGAFTRATTRKGHTKARVDTVNRPVKKTLDVITQHITQVTHDLAWHEWLIDANRLIDAGPINDAIRTHYGTAVLRTMKDAVMAIATADVVPQTKMDQALLHLRANISRSTMGFSLTTAFMQPFGLTQSMVRIGPTHVLRGIARWGGDAARFENSLTWIQEKSDFMRLRSKTFNRELHEINGRVSHGRSKARQIYDASLFMMMQKMQLVADVPTWIGSYEKALASGSDEATAVAMADQGVLDSQGGGQTKDMAELQRKHPLLSMFYSYFNVTYNLAAESTAKTDFKNPLALAGWVSDMALLMIIPALGPAILLELLRGGGDDEDKWAKKLLEWQSSYMLGTVMGLRETSGLVAGFDYSGPPVGRIVGDLGKMSKQVSQGEADEPLALAALRLLGSATGIPSVQIIRSWRGWRAWEDGNAPVTSVLIGPPAPDK